MRAFPEIAFANNDRYSLICFPMRPKLIAVCFAVLCNCVSAQAPAPKKPDWTPLKFLVGSWVADPNPKEPGTTGSSVFRFDLDGNIMVRENKADYPAQNGKPAQHHRDLMVIFADDSGALKASYWDNEPHTIHYDVTADGDEVRFVTTPETSGPRFRLVYKRTDENSAGGRFDIALPGGDFKPYKEWTMHRN